MYVNNGAALIFYFANELFFASPSSLLLAADPAAAAAILLDAPRRGEEEHEAAAGSTTRAGRVASQSKATRVGHGRNGSDQQCGVPIALCVVSVHPDQGLRRRTKGLLLTLPLLPQVRRKNWALDRPVFLINYIKSNAPTTYLLFLLHLCCVHSGQVHCCTGSEVERDGGVQNGSKVLVSAAAHAW